LTKPPRLTPETEREIIALRENGATVAEITERLALPRTQVHGLLARRGIKVAPDIALRNRRGSLSKARSKNSGLLETSEARLLLDMYAAGLPFAQCHERAGIARAVARKIILFASAELKLMMLRSWASKSGSTMISTSWRGPAKKHEFRCSSGHTFHMNASNLQKGQGCGKCARVAKRKTIEQLHEEARVRGFQCLSQEYQTNAQKYLFKCGIGHEFHMRATHILMGQGCPECAYEAGLKSIAHLRELAARHEGMVRSTVFKTMRDKYEFCCHRNHVFSAIGHNVQQGQWCPDCFRIDPSKSQQAVQDVITSLAPGAQLKTCDRTLLTPLEIDVLVPESRLAVEYTGLIWHSSWTDGYRRTRHWRKALACQRAQHDLVVVFDDEWRSPSKRQVVTELVARRMGLGETIGASPQLVQLEACAATEFLAAHALDPLGNDGSTVFALQDGIGIVGVAVLEKCPDGRHVNHYVSALVANSARRVHDAEGKVLDAMLATGKCTSVMTDNRLGLDSTVRRRGLIPQRDLRSSRFFTDGYARLRKDYCARLLSESGHGRTSLSEAANSGLLGQLAFGRSKRVYWFEDYGHRIWKAPPSSST
jgi:hypothetical protein